MKNRISLILLLAGALALRLGLSLIARPIIDIQNFERTASIVMTNGPSALYAQTNGMYPYPPIWIWWQVGAKMLDLGHVFSFPFAVRLPVILADLGIVYTIWLWQARQPLLKRLTWSAAYAFNPVALIITCLHGQFDAIPVFFSTLAVYHMIRSPQRLHAAWFLAAAILFKPYPVLLLGLFILAIPTWRQRLAFATISLAPVGISLLPYLLMNPADVFRELFGYQGVGLLGALVPLRTLYVPLTNQHFPTDITLQIISLSKWVFLGLYAGFLLWIRCRLDLLTGALAIWLMFFVFFTGISPQYLVWLLPLWAMGAPDLAKGLWVYTVTATLALIGFYSYAVPDTLLLTYSADGISKWLYGIFGSLWWASCLGLLVWLLRRMHRFSTEQGGAPAVLPASPAP